MKTSIFLPNSIDKNKVGPILEQIEIALSKGEKITLIYCNKIISSCSLNPNSNALLCKACCSNFSRIFSKFLNNKDILITDLKSYLCSNINYPIELNNANTLSQFQEIYFDDKIFDVGWSVVSSHVSRTRDISNNVSDKHVKILRKNIRSSINIYCLFNQYIIDTKPDKIIIFNGRLFETRPVLRICQKLGVYCSVIEISGHSGINWVEYKNSLPHNLKEYSKKVKDHWYCNSTTKDRDQIGHDFFHLRRNGKATNDRSHIDIQNQKQLPKDFDNSKINILIFNSSEDEIFSIGPSWKKKFKSQYDAVIHISNLLINDDRYFIYLRMHPNLRDVKSKFVEELLDLDRLDNVEVIPPSSSISSYSLLDASNSVITFGSTIGIEATYWGKPSLTLSDCFYSGINGAYSVFNIDILEFILNKNLPALNKESALMYGYYQLTIGKKFKLWNNNFFKGKLLPQPDLVEKIFYNLNRFLIGK